VLASITPNTGIIVVVSPNNPSGFAAKASDLKQLSLAAPHAVILADLAYSSFADEDLTEAALNLPNAIAVHTLSKAWGMAGLRVGFAAGPAQIIDCLRRVGPPYPVSGISLVLAEKWLSEGEDHVRQYIAQVRSERRQLEQLLRELGATVHESQGNFVFAGFKDSLWIHDALAGLGILCRIFSALDGFEEGIRITCPGNQSNCDRLARTLRVICKPEALLFDMDGVLANDSRSYRVAIAVTAESYGVHIEPDEIAAAKAEGNANNEWEVTRRLLEKHGVQADTDEVTKRFESIYQGTQEKPGLRETESLLVEAKWLRHLSKKIPIAVVTGRPRADAMRFLEKERIADLFKTVVCLEDGPLKPDPAPVLRCMKNLGVSRAWMIGDTPDDVIAARSAGVLPLGIVAPSDDKSKATAALLRAGAARVLADLYQMEELLQ